MQAKNQLLSQHHEIQPHELKQDMKDFILIPMSHQSAAATLSPREIEENAMGTAKIDNELDPKELTSSPIQSHKLAQENLSGEQIGDESIEYPHGLKLAIIIAALCLAVFLVALDQTIISTAIPKITDSFHSVNDIGWYGASYLLTRTALQPTFGRIYSTFSIKYTFLTAIGIFEFGSLLCAVARTSNVLIIGRAVAGAGVGGLFTGSILVVIYSLPLHKRPAVMGIISSMWSVASVAGPVIGGVFTDRISWRWCFYINLPVGALSFIVITFVLHIHRDNNPENLSFQQRILKLDLIGAVILIPATVCLLLPLQLGGPTYPWNSSRIVGLFIGAGGLISIFIYSQIKLGDKATLPPSLFQNRNILCAFIFSGAFGAGFYPLTFYLSIYFQSVKNSTALHTGIQLLPLAISCTFSSVSTGFLISAVGYYKPIIIFCMAIFSIGTGLFTTLSVTSSFGRLCGYQILTGLGIGVGFEAGIIVVQTVLSGAKVPEAISCVSFSMTIGGAIFLPVSQALFQNRLLKCIETKTPQLDASVFLKSGATEIRSLLASINQQGALDLVLQAYVEGVKNTLWVAVACAIAAFVAACGLEWKSVKKESGER